MSFEAWSNQKKKEREEEEKKFQGSSSTSQSSSSSKNETKEPTSFEEWSNKKNGGKKGWEKYLADQESTEQKEREDESFWDKLGRWLGPTGATDTTLPMGNTAQITHQLREDTSYQRPSDNWSDEQRYEFGALYLESPEKAFAYAEETNRKNNQTKEEADIKKVQDSATSNGWAGLAHTAGAIAAAPMGMADYLNMLVLSNAGRDPLESDGIVSPFEYSTAVTEGIAADLNEKGGTLDEDIFLIGGKGWGDVYGLGVSIAQSAVSGYTLGPVGTLVSYFGQGAASGMKDALERGADEGTAAFYGAALGAIEGIAESIGIDNLFKMGSSSTVKGLLKNILNQAKAEGLEELLTSFCSNVIDNLAMQDKSNFYAMVSQYMAVGMSEEEAKKQAWWDSVEGIAYDALAGFVSGGVHGGVQTGIQTGKYSSYVKNSYGDQVEDLLIEAGQTQREEGKTSDDVDKYIDKYGEKGKLSGLNIAHLLEITDTNKIKSTAESRLTQLGEKGNISQLADILTKQVQGKELSKAEQELLDKSTYGQRVANELNPENIRSGQYATNWSEQIGTRQINAREYNMGKNILGENLSNKLITKGVPEKSKYKVSEDGKTTLNDQEVSIQGVESIKGGEVTVRLESGETVNASDLKLSDKEALMYDIISRMDATPDTANQILSQFKPTSAAQASMYYNSIPLAYEYGKINYEAGLKNINMPKHLKNSVFTRGRIDAMIQAEAKTPKTNVAQKGSNKTKSGIIYEDGFVYHEASANEMQRVSMAHIEVINKMSNLEVHIFESKVENGKRVAYVNGKLVSAPNGYFKDGNKIYIDFNAGNKGEGAMLYTMSHEITHYIREWNAEGFKELGDFLIEQYGKKGVNVEYLLEQQRKKIKKRYAAEGKALPSEAKLNDMAYEEMVADAMSDMLADPKAYEKLAKLKQQNKTLWEKVGEAIKAVLDKLKDALGVYKERDVAVAEEATKVRDFSSDVYDKLQDLYIKAFVEADANYAAAEQTLSENGIVVDTSTESASIYSVRDVLDDDQRQNVSKALATRFGVTQKEALQWLTAETSLASLILNPKYSQYLDYEPDPNEVAIKTNSDYPQGTVDFSPICAKRREFTAVMNNVLRLFKNHVFAATDLAKIRSIMQEEGMTIPCGICYVEDRRQLDTIVAQNFIDSLKLYREGSKTRPDGKAFNTNQLKGLKLTDGDSYTPTIYELVSLEGLNVLKEKNPSMAEAWIKFNNARGMQSVRLLANEAEYKRQILKYGKQTVKAKNDKGGLRIYSFSDAEMFHLIDIIQVITDSATVGLSLQGYTKVNEYAKAVKDTGEKLNRSLIPKGELGYHIEDGKVVLDYDTVEGIDINHPDFFDNKANPNVGNITIGVSDTQIRAAMVSDFVDQIIPFHTGQSEDVLGEKGIATWSNYKDFQTEKDIATGKVSDHQINIYTEVLQPLEKEGKPITKRTFVEKFLQVCKDNNLTPRFSQFLNTNENGEFVYTEGYHKMLVDFKTFAQTETGEYLPQKPVKPIFDNEYITKILKDYVKSQEVKDAELAKSMPKVIERITNEIVKPSETKFSDRDSEGNELSTEQIGFFKDSKVRDKKGNLLVLYHGTTANFNTFKKGDIGFHFGTKGAARGRVGFGKNVTLKEVYLNITNPIVFDEDLGSWDADFRLAQELYEKGILTMDELRTVLISDDGTYRRPTESANKKLAAVLITKGYDGISYQNTFETKKATTSYIVFNSNQVKEITNKTPTSSPDIRYSDRDSSYLDAVNRGDMVTAQKMVDEAAKKAGYTIKGNHGTLSYFTIFDRSYGNAEGDWGKGFYFTNNEGDAEANYASADGADLQVKIEKYAQQLGWTEEYGDLDYDELIEVARKELTKGDPRIIKAYLRMENPVVVGGQNETYFDFTEEYNEETDEYEEPSGKLVEFVEALSSVLEDITLNGGIDADRVNVYELFQDGDGYTASQLEKAAERLLENVMDENGDYASKEIIRAAFEAIGFDGIVDNTVAGKFGDRSGRRNPMEGVTLDTTHYIAFTSNQIKQSDPVTYDNNGNVIPLSERFDADNNDIRYSDRDPYSYETLTSKPDMKITTLDGTVPSNRADVVFQAKKNAASVGKFNKDGGVLVHVDDTDTDVLLSTDGLKHGLRRTKNLQAEANAIVTLKAGEILKNSIRINELTPSKANAIGSYVLIGSAKDSAGNLYIVRSVVNQFTSELTSMDVLYAINTKKESAVLNAPRSTVKLLSVTDSTISIAHLLEIVNRYFPDILPESVLRHYGYDARPEGNLGENVLYSDRVTDEETLEFLENQEHVTVYRAMQVIDGKLYPPMNAYTKDETGKKVLMPHTEFGEWEQAVERPDLIDPKTGKFKLDKGKVDGGKKGTIIPAAYNPYIHTSASPLNDQFSSAYKRSNLVVVEGKIPSSELTSGYRAEFAKNTVGETQWHSGPVAGKLKGEKARRVFLSRWFKPVRIVPDSEVASMIAKTLEGENIDVPYNVVTPSLRTELEKAGVSILYSERDPNATSNRTLLANALESTAKTDKEKEKLKQYKTKIALIESEQARLTKIRAEIKKLSFAKGPRDTAKIRSLQDSATQIENRINTYDRQLLNLESTEALKGVLQREKQMAYKKAKEEGREALRRQRERDAETVRTLLTQHRESRQRATESRNKTAMKAKIKKVVHDLNKLLLNPTQDKHVPIGLQKVVAEALDAINMDSMNAEERVAYYNDLISKSSNPDEIAMLTKKRDFFEYRDMNFKERITELKNAYAEFKESDDPLIRNAHNDAIADLIKNTADEVGNKSLKDMSLSQLERVYDMYKAILATVRNANKMFKEGRQETVTENSDAVKLEVRSVGGHKDRVLKMTKFLKKFGWDMLKPVTALKVIGSTTFERLFNNVRAAEDTWAVDVNEAKQFFDDIAAKYGYNKWDLKKYYTFKDSAGTNISITLEQIMSLYAYSKRNQADKHLEDGGFVFDDAIEVIEKNKFGIPLKYEVNDANPYRLRKEHLLDITDALTKEQKDFVDAMQTYLSDVMGAKGNEVSLAMYDIKLYKEQNYFPLKTSRYFREFDPEKSATPKIKNSGFSKKTVPQAGNPIVLSNFMDVWAGHVNDMSMYHAFVLPLEDFMRVYNYSSTTGGYDSVQQYIKNAYGVQANQYIEKLMDDLNGGARVDSSAGIINKGLSLFKKASVFASASVVVQQPSAIARALAYIDPKYFAKATPEALNIAKHKTLWAEVKKYAPVAVIKEMGYFDTGVGRSTVEWIKGNQTFKDKMDDVLSKAPAIADELCWVHIWEAVKRENAAKSKSKVGSEIFLMECGKRFTEIITNTQVYDSVLSRSGMMRSKDTGMKMATAFMAEPTTTVNMMVDGIIQGKRGNKKFTASTVGAVSASIILNSILVALVYAARDDDEDETYLEKYVGSVTSELLDGFNPLTYIPFVKDVWSIAQGYDVERSDMSVVGKLWESIEGLFNENKSGLDKVLEVAGSVSSLFGIPLKNIIRDAKGMYNLTNTILSGTPTTGAGIKEAIGESFKSSIPLWDRLHESDSKSDKLYDAIISGDQNQIDRVKATYKSEQALETALKTALRENDSRINEAAQARLDGNISEYTRIAREIIAEGHFSQDTVVAAINAEMNAIKKAQSESIETEPTDDKDEATSIYRADDISIAFDNGDKALALSIIDELIEMKVANGMDETKAKSSLRSSMTSYWKPLYIAASESGNTSELQRIKQILYYSGLYGSAADVVKAVKSWTK